MWKNQAKFSEVVLIVFETVCVTGVIAPWSASSTTEMSQGFKEPMLKIISAELGDSWCLRINFAKGSFFTAISSLRWHTGSKGRSHQEKLFRTEFSQFSLFTMFHTIQRAKETRRGSNP